MVIKMTNKSEKFYKYMGKIFGSRLIEKETNDRIYDDDNKIWYMYIEEKKVKAFVSINENVIKNIYTTKDEYLEEILKKIIKEIPVTYSIVPNKYIDVYKKSGLLVSQNANYKNFVTIYIDRITMPKL